MTDGAGAPGRRGLDPPALLLAADHRARGVATVERFADYVAVLGAALASADGILATAEPLATLARSGLLGPGHRTYLSLNRTGLAGSAFELDDRLVTSVERARAEGWTGVKHMTRIDLADPLTAPALELLGAVLDAATACGLDALVESVVWRDGAMARDPDAIVYAAVIAHDLGAPALKVPVPDVAPGAAREDAVARVVASVGVPVLFLGGPPPSGTAAPDQAAADAALVAAVHDVMAGGAAGLAIGRAVLLHPDPGAISATLADIVHGR